MQKAPTEISHIFRKLNPRRSYGQPWVLAYTENLPLTFNVLEITHKHKKTTASNSANSVTHRSRTAYSWC